MGERGGTFYGGWGSTFRGGGGGTSCGRWGSTFCGERGSTSYGGGGGSKAPEAGLSHRNSPLGGEAVSEDSAHVGAIGLASGGDMVGDAPIRGLVVN